MSSPALYKKHDPASHTKYQDTKRLARSQRRILAGTPGTLKKRTQSGNQYWVREYIRADGRKTDEYIGAVNAIDENTVTQIEEEIELARKLARSSGNLRLFGFQRIDRKPAAVIETLHNKGLFEAGLTLVGSHAYGGLLNELGVISAGYKTEDIDLARARPLAIALPDGVSLQAIPLLDFLVAEPTESIVLSPNQVIPVTLPSPERFLIHKLFSSQSRRKSDRDKVRKDLAQAAVLSAAIEEETPGRIADVFREMPASGKPAARRGSLAASKLLGDAYPEAKEVLLKLAG